jgi:thiol-disulfide isomerase/thioredoxin
MNALLPALAVIGLVVVATAIGLILRAQNGRVRQLAHGRVISTRELPKFTRLGSQATLLQFSTDVCAPCRTTHSVLQRVANDTPNVLHVDLNLTHRPDLANHFKIMQTPTTFILDGRGVVRARIGGAAKRETVEAELNRILVGT